MADASWEDGKIFPNAGLPAHLPANLPPDLLLSPADADFYWIERWDSNDAWANPAMWQTPSAILNHPDVAASGLGFDFLLQQRWIFRADNYQDALSRGIINNVLGVDHTPAGFALQEIQPPGGFPNAPGARVWVPSASDTFPDGGNDNIDMNVAPGEFTVGELTVQNFSNDAGRSFRQTGTLVMDSGDPARNARIVLLGADRSIAADQDGVPAGAYQNWSDDLNFRAGAEIRLDSNTEVYLLSETWKPRMRLRGNAQITGDGDLIINPGNAQDYANTGSDNALAGSILRELRVEDFSAIRTTGEIHVGAAQLTIGTGTLGESPVIENTAGIFIHPQGQLRLNIQGFANFEPFYDFNAFGGAVITLNSMGHLMNEGSRGAIRMHRDGLDDIARIENTIHVLGDSAIHVRGEATLILDGDVYGAGLLEKSGTGTLRLTGAVELENTILVRGGRLELNQDSSLSFLIGAVGNNNRIANLEEGVGNLFFDGEFIFDLSGASKSPGDFWTIVESGFEVVEYGPNFHIPDFTEISPGIWRSDNPFYQFSQITGQLAVIPEPGALGGLSLAAALVWILRRRLKATRPAAVRRRLSQPHATEPIPINKEP